MANRCVFLVVLKPLLAFIDHWIHLNESESTKVLKVQNEQIVWKFEKLWVGSRYVLEIQRCEIFRY